MFSIEERLIGSGHGGMPVHFTVRGHEFHTGFKKILVVWKGKIQCVDVHAFGDGMEAIEIGTKPFMMQQIRKECLTQAALFYREYDEEYDTRVSYAYHFPKDQELLDEVTGLLPDGVSLVIHNTFVVVQAKETLLDPEKLRVSLQQNGKRGILSFFYGLGLLYGQRIGEGEAMEIRLPLQGSIVQYQELLEWMRIRLLKQGYAIQRTLTNGTVGQWYEIHINDREILEQFAVWQGVDGPLPGRQRATHYQSTLLDYLKMEHTPGKTMDTIKHGLLKLWKK